MPCEAKYVDLQVNGYAGVDFNSDSLTLDAMQMACRRLRDDGVAGLLATIITDSVDLMAARLAKIVRLRQEDPAIAELVWGFHVEGPFLNNAPGYSGAHPAEHIRPAELDVMKRLLEAGEGLVRLVTLAPERDEQACVTRFLASQGIRVAAGHCDPSLNELRAAIDVGLSMFTHLGNGCPGQLARHDNVIMRALALGDRLTLCFIGDGVHVPYMALASYLRVAGMERTVVVTDAMAAAGCGPGRHRIGVNEVEIGEDLIAWSPDRSHLMGLDGHDADDGDQDGSLAGPPSRTA